jgi:mannose-6-phosphate isomerase-like protein (cupin superfamily)
MKKDEYISGKEFHSTPHDVYSGPLGWAVNKHSGDMAKVVYTAVHENAQEQGIKRGSGHAYSKWVFSEEPGLQEHLFSTAFELLIDSTLEPNAAIGLHLHHSTEEIYYILEGNITITTVSADGQEFTETLRAGDAHMVKLGQGHYGVAGADGVRFLAIAVRAENRQNAR